MDCNCIPSPALQNGLNIKLNIKRDTTADNVSMYMYCTALYCTLIDTISLDKTLLVVSFHTQKEVYE
jgi:hypothetical protein